MKVKVWGARGSVPAPGPEMNRYGGNTSCVEIRIDETLFICECSDPDCTQGIHLTLEQYEDVRSELTHFIVKPGHEDPAVERVAESKRSHDVVDKDAPGAADTATELDPRA